MVRIPEQKYDAMFPQLNAALDSQHMKECFQRELLSAHARKRVRIVKLHLRRFLYRPGQRCRLLYDVQLEDPAAGALAREMVVCDLISAHGPAAGRSAKPWFRPSPYFPAFAELENPPMRCTVFPNDWKLSQLPDVMNEAYLMKLIASGVGAENQRKKNGDVSIVKYVPGDRAVLRVTSVNGYPGNGFTYYVKTTRKPDKTVFDALKILWQNLQETDFNIAIPRPVAYDGQTHTMVLGEVSGRKLTDNLAQLPAEKIGQGAAQLLALIHGSAVPHLGERTAVMEREEFEKALAIIRSRYLDGEAKLQELSGKMLSKWPLDTPEKRPIHGAFRATQMLYSQGKIGLVDFDGLLLGDPHLDVASFISHLVYLTVKKELTPDELNAIASHFLEDYRRMISVNCQPRRLAHLVAADLITKHGKKMIKRAKDGGEQILEQLINNAWDVYHGAILPFLLN